MNREPFPYCVYVVRVWKENGRQVNNAGWRFTVTATPSAQRQGFASPHALCEALYREILRLIQQDLLPETDRPPSGDQQGTESGGSSLDVV